jgi:hypothetical protein
MSERKCSKCGQVKAIERFDKRGYGYHAVCRVCRGHEKRSILAANKRKTREYMREWNNIHKDKVWERDLKSNHNITSDVFDRLNQQLGGLCAVCSRPEPNAYRKRLSVDKDDKGNVRGLVCSRCAIILSAVKKESGLLNNIVKYVIMNETKSG